MQNVDGFEFNDSQKIWRYMKVSRFTEFLQSRTIHFASAFQFEDRFEGAVAVQPYNFPIDPRYSEPEKFETAFEELKRLTKINCWHIEDYESDAMWQLYADSGKGVAITSTPKRISESLKPFRLRSNYGVEELRAGNVQYVDLTNVRLSPTMLERFFYKHLAFAWEQEFRLAISLRIAEEFGVDVPKEGIHVEVDPFQLIETVQIGPKLDEEARTKVIDDCTVYGLGERVLVTSLLDRPKYIQRKMLLN